MKLTVLSGRKFGRLTVGDRAPNVGKNTMWHCICDCGQPAIVAAKHLKSGATTSCGCWMAESKVIRQTKHGDAPFNGGRTPEYRIWRHIKSRCLNPNVAQYGNYGGRGIKICDAWLSNYSAFLRDMGRRPSARHSIERLDVNGHYEPTNCVWATPVDQSRNRRHIHITLEIAERIRSGVAAGVHQVTFARQYGVSPSVISSIIRNLTWRVDHV